MKKYILLLIQSIFQLPLIISFLKLDLENIFYLNQFFWYTILVYIIFSVFFLLFFKEKKSLKNFSIFSISLIILLIPWIILWYFFANTMQSYDNSILRISGKIAFFYLSMALLINPLSYFVSDKYYSKLIFIRKIFGILSFLFFMIHLLNYIELERYYHFWDSSLLEYIFKNIKNRMDALTWLIAWFIMLILWISSNNFSQKILGSIWKWIHYMVYPLFLLSMIHIAFASRIDLFYMILFSSVIIFRTIVFFKKNSVYKNIKAWKTTKYICIVCWYIYDENKGDPDWGLLPWTKFEDIPNDWVCPLCWVSKKDFIPYYEEKQNYKKVEIAEIHYLTKDVIKLVIKSNSNLEYFDWQFIKFVLEDFDWEFIRQYSIADKSWLNFTFFIKLKANGRASKLFPKLNKWDNLKIAWIFGEFKLKINNKSKVFLATWTGLAPIYSMINNPNIKNCKKYLHFWVANQNDLFYLDELKKIENLEINIYLSKENINIYNYWRINVENFKYDKEIEFYICWNPWLVIESKEKLIKMWYENIYYEKFE